MVKTWRFRNPPSFNGSYQKRDGNLFKISHSKIRNGQPIIKFPYRGDLIPQFPIMLKEVPMNNPIS